MLTRPFTAALAAFAILAAAPAIAAPPAPVSPPVPTVSTPAPSMIVLSGDSLSQGNEDYSGVTLATALRSALNMPVLNNGVGSQKSTQIIMRQGGVPIQITLSGNQIGYPQTQITAINGVAPTGMATTQDPDYRFLSNLGGTNQSGTVNLRGTLCGIHGGISRNPSGGPPSTTETYYFYEDTFSAVTNVLSANPQACPANSIFTPDDLNLSAPAVIWVGQNNALPAQTTQVESDIDGAVAALAAAKSPGYVILGLFQAEYEPNGNAVATAKAALNSRNATTYGSHFLDVKAMLDANYNPANLVDVYDHANGIAPYTLRAVSSAGTLNGAISSTSTCSFALTATYGSIQNNAVISVDSEYILVTAFSGSSVTGCTRGYAGSTAATHSSGAKYLLTDPLHLGGNADTLIANYIATNMKTALLGSLPPAVITSQALSAILSGPIDAPGTYYFEQPINAARGIYLLNNSCIYAPGTGSVGFASTPAVFGTLNPVICETPGSGTITIGGAWNTKICLTIGGTVGCTVSLNSQGALVTQGEVKTVTIKSSGTTYAATQYDREIEIKTGAAFAVTLMSSPATGQMVTIKDGSGAASTGNITVTASAGNIEGAANYVINANYGKVTLMYDGSQWVTI